VSDHRDASAIWANPLGWVLKEVCVRAIEERKSYFVTHPADGGFACVFTDLTPDDLEECRVFAENMLKRVTNRYFERSR
jgi:3-deoxy-D-arabino-heptulosonate 7-phosphate (DAHP) synthase class II